MTYGEMIMVGATAFTAAGSLVFALVLVIGVVWRDCAKDDKGHAKTAARAM